MNERGSWSFQSKSWNILMVLDQLVRLGSVSYLVVSTHFIILEALNSWIFRYLNWADADARTTTWQRLWYNEVHKKAISWHWMYQRRTDIVSVATDWQTDRQEMCTPLFRAVLKPYGKWVDKSELIDRSTINMRSNYAKKRCQFFIAKEKNDYFCHDIVSFWWVALRVSITWI